MELIEKKSFVCGNRRGEGERSLQDFNGKNKEREKERERKIGEIEVYCSTLDVTISIFSTVLLFSRAARSLIVDSCNGFDKWRERKKKKKEKKIRPFSHFSFFLSYHAQLFLSWNAGEVRRLVAKRRFDRVCELCNRRTSGDTDRMEKDFSASRLNRLGAIG